MRNPENEYESDHNPPQKSRLHFVKTKVNWIIIILNLLLFVLFSHLFSSQPSDAVLNKLWLGVDINHSDTNIKVDLSKTPPDPTLVNQTRNPRTNIKVRSKKANYSWKDYKKVDSSVPVPLSDQRKTWLTPVYQSYQNERYLCRMFKNNCRSYFITDSIDLFWLVAPIYSFNIEADALYVEKHLLFKSYMQSIGLSFITIEAIRIPNQYPPNLHKRSKEARNFICTNPDNEPYDIQVYYYNVSYIRENLVNVAIRKLDKLAPWEHMAWIDAHQIFENTYWWEESIYKAEKYGTIQLFDSLQVFNENNSTIVWTAESIIRKSLHSSSSLDENIAYGNAYVISRSNYYAIGYIYDECIATCCDCAYVLGSLPSKAAWDPIYTSYFKGFELWINNTRKALQYSRSYVRGNLTHIYHGRVFPYISLMEAAEKFAFNSTQDIQRDENFSIIITNKKMSAVAEWIIFEAKLSWDSSLNS